MNNKELYDISSDPYEKTNVAANHADVIAAMRKAYDVWWAETVPLMVNEDAPYAAQQPQAVRYENQLEQHGIPKWTAPEL